MNTTSITPPTSTTPDDPSAARREPLPLRVLRSVVCILLTLGLILLTGLTTLGLLPSAREAFKPFYVATADVSLVAIGLTFAFMVLTPLVVMIFAARKRLLRWPVLGVACGVLIIVFVWLAVDEPAGGNRLSLEEFSPKFPGAEQSFATLMRFSKQSKSAESKAFDAVKFAVTWGPGGSTREAAKFRDYITTNRAAIESDWAALAPQRKWLEELAAYDRIGDLTPPRIDADIMKFSVYRTLSQRLCAIALLQAIDGRGDEAMATLRPLIHVSRRLQTSSRTLVRTMIAVVSERMAIETAFMVLETTPVSASSKANLAAALGTENGIPLARRLILTEYAVFAPAVMQEPIGAVIGATNSRLSRKVLNAIGVLIFNPNASMNLYGDHLSQLATLAQERSLDEFDKRSKAFNERIRHEPAMKNLAGQILIQIATPALNKVVASHWETTDLRVKLRQQLAG